MRLFCCLRLFGLFLYFLLFSIHNSPHIFIFNRLELVKHTFSFFLYFYKILFLLLLLLLYTIHVCMYVCILYSFAHVITNIFFLYRNLVTSGAPDACLCMMWQYVGISYHSLAFLDCFCWLLNNFCHNSRRIECFWLLSYNQTKLSFKHTLYKLL